MKLAALAAHFLGSLCLTLCVHYIQIIMRTHENSKRLNLIPVLMYVCNKLIFTCLLNKLELWHQKVARLG